MKWKKLGLIIVTLITVSCGQTENKTQGYVEGRLTYIATSFAGILQQISVQSGETVKIQQPLFVLEEQPESDVVIQAQAQKNQSMADLSLAALTLKRQQFLLRKGAVQQETVDTALTQFQKAQAQFSAAQGALAQAQWSRKQKTLFSPKDAIVFDTYFLPGELVPATQPVLSLLAPEDIKIIFFVPETQLSTISLGKPIQISCDSCKAIIMAKINFISPQAEYTPPVIYSEKDRAKLVYRVEATPAIPDAIKLHPGQPVTIRYG